MANANAADYRWKEFAMSSLHLGAAKLPDRAQTATASSSSDTEAGNDNTTNIAVVAGDAVDDSTTNALLFLSSSSSSTTTTTTSASTTAMMTPSTSTSTATATNNNASTQQQQQQRQQQQRANLSWTMNPLANAVHEQEDEAQDTTIIARGDELHPSLSIKDLNTSTGSNSNSNPNLATGAKAITSILATGLPSGLGTGMDEFPAPNRLSADFEAVRKRNDDPNATSVRREAFQNRIRRETGTIGSRVAGGRRSSAASTGTQPTTEPKAEIAAEPEATSSVSSAEIGTQPRVEPEANGANGSAETAAIPSIHEPANVPTDAVTKAIVHNEIPIHPAHHHDEIHSASLPTSQRRSASLNELHVSSPSPVRALSSEDQGIIDTNASGNANANTQAQAQAHAQHRGVKQRLVDWIRSPSSGNRSRLSSKDEADEHSPPSSVPTLPILPTKPSLNPPLLIPTSSSSSGMPRSGSAASSASATSSAASEALKEMNRHHRRRKHAIKSMDEAQQFEYYSGLPLELTLAGVEHLLEDFQVAFLSSDRTVRAAFMSHEGSEVRILFSLSYTMENQLCAAAKDTLRQGIGIRTTSATSNVSAESGNERQNPPRPSELIVRIECKHVSKVRNDTTGSAFREFYREFLKAFRDLDDIAVVTLGLKQQRSRGESAERTTVAV